MPGKVVDASVLAALVFQEFQAREAAALIGDAELWEPRLLAYELASVARKKVMLHPGEHEGILAGLESALAMNIQWFDVAQTDVLILALETGLSTYDSSYLYLAQMLGVPLATFDRRLLAVAQQRGAG